MVRRYSRARFLRTPHLSRLGWFGVVIAAAIAMLAILELTDTTHFLHKNPSKEIVTVGTPVSPPKQNVTSKTSAKTPVSNTSDSRNMGGITDTQGSAATPTKPNQWTTSASGYITVKQPVANAKIADGSVVSGSAKIDEIHYRLIDNVVGVVAQGTLSVVNGDFSGTLKFQPKGTGGRLDVFSTDSGGVEYNEVQVNVSF